MRARDRRGAVRVEFEESGAEVARVAASTSRRIRARAGRPPFALREASARRSSGVGAEARAAGTRGRQQSREGNVSRPVAHSIETAEVRGCSRGRGGADPDARAAEARAANDPDARAAEARAAVASRRSNVRRSNVDPNERLDRAHVRSCAEERFAGRSARRRSRESSIRIAGGGGTEEESAAAKGGDGVS